MLKKSFRGAMHLYFVFLLLANTNNAKVDTENLRPLPKRYNNFIRDLNSLDHVRILVNNKEHVLLGGEVLPFVKGDILLISEVKIHSNKKAITEVNLVGFRNPSPSSFLLDDRNVKIDTRNHFGFKWSSDYEGSLYPVIIAENKTILGIVYIRRIIPRLKWTRFLIDGREETIYADQTLFLREKEQLKVQEISTNLQEVSDIKVRMVKKTKENEGKLYQMKFLRRDFHFASIQIKVLASK